MATLEKPTIIERFVQLIPLDYPVAALVWTIIFGPFGSVLFNAIDTGQIFYIFNAAVIYNSISLTITLYYLFYIPRYLRLRILGAEQQIAPLMPGGEEEYHAAFRHFTSTLPVIVLTIPFLSPIEGAVPLRASVSTVFFLLQYIILAVGLGSLVWEYTVSGWGLHKLGESQLRLKSFLEDRMMGAKPVGNTALSATTTYFGGLLFILFLGTSNPIVNGPVFYIFMLFLLALGVVMFFLPLNSLHRKMQAEKARYQKDLGFKFLAMIQQSEASPSHGPVPSLRTENATAQLLWLKELEITERKLAATPTWPFDVQVIARLITIVLSVAGVLISRFILDYLIKI